MTAQTEIEYLVRNYPLTCNNRIVALNHLLLVSGNGRAWVGGELKDVVVGDPKEDRPESDFDNLPDEFRATRANYKSLSAPGGTWAFSRWFVSEYCALANLPDDLQPDWAEVAWEVIAAVKQTPKASFVAHGRFFPHSAWQRLHGVIRGAEARLQILGYTQDQS